jgi:hypothetical protein
MQFQWWLLPIKQTAQRTAWYIIQTFTPSVSYQNGVLLKHFNLCKRKENCISWKFSSTQQTRKKMLNIAEQDNGHETIPDIKHI